MARCAFALGMCTIVTAGALQASANEFVLENNSNVVVQVAVAHTTPNNRVRDEGWYVIRPGNREVIYRGDNERIAIHMQNWNDRSEIRPHKFLGTVSRYTCTQRFIREDTDTPGNIRLTWGPSLDQVYFKDQNDQLPPGWFDTTYYIVPANERFTVIP
jgi:hypothetical protein